MISDSDSRLNLLKRQIVQAAVLAGEGHIASAFSILDILWILYDRILDFDPANPRKPARDRFILSKGHGALGLYAILAEKGYFSASELQTFAAFESRLGGHPDCNKLPGVEASTGSLGHGMPFGIGMSLGMRIRNIDKRVFILVGDGECNEGTIWESALLASHHHLNRVTCIVDHNHSTDRALGIDDLVKKFEAFGWEAASIDGHNHEEIYAACADQHPTCPKAVIAETIKGKGCQIMESNPAWHHRVPSKEELQQILTELT